MPKKILIVDDEKSFTNMYISIFSSQGYEAKGVFTGEEALEALSKEAFDLIILDVGLPGIPGTEVAKVATAKYPSVKILILSGYTESEFKAKLDGAKVHASMRKPVTAPMLIAKIKELTQ